MKYYPFLFSLFFSFSLLAQTENETVKQEQPAEAFALANIVDAKQATDDLSRESIAKAKDSTTYVAFKQRFYKISKQYRDTISDSITLDFESLTIWELKDKKNIWTEYNKDWATFSEDLHTEEQGLYKQLESVNFLNRQWVKTRAMIDTLDVSEAIETPVNNAILQTDSVQNLLKARIEDFLVLSNNTQAEMIAVNGILENINNLRAKSGTALLSKDSPPFFTALKTETPEQGLWQSFKSATRKNWNETKDFFSENVFGLFLHILSIIGFYIFMAYIKNLYTASDTNQKDELKIADRILLVPAVNSIVLGMVATPVFYVVVPAFFIDALTVVSIVPILVLLPRIFKASMLRFFSFLAVLILINKLVAQLEADFYYQRILLLLMSVVGIVGFAIFLQPRSWFVKLLKDTKRIFLLRILQLFVLVLVFGLYCNLAGIYQLSLLLTRGVVHSFTVGLVMFLTINVIVAVSLFLLKRGAKTNSNLLRNYHQNLEKWTTWLVIIFGFWTWFRATLRGFALLVPISQWLEEFVNKSWEFGEINLSVQNIVDFVTILAIFILIANVFHIVLREEILNRLDIRKGVPLALSVLTRYIILLLGFVLAMSSAGISLDKLGLIIGALGVGIGFGLQGIVSNFVSGLVIIFERPVHIGDVISTSLAEGELIQIGLRSSRIRTWEGAEVIVPNNDLIAKEVTNWTFTDKKRRLERIVLIESGPSPREVKEIMDEVMEAHSGILENPASRAYFLGYENNALKFRLLIWLTTDLLETPSDLMIKLYDALAEKGFTAYMPVQKVVLENRQGTNMPGVEEQDANPD